MPSSSTELIPADRIDRAAQLLRSGNPVAFPTDTFFALGVVLEDKALSKLFDVKGRMSGNPVPVLLASADQVSQVSVDFPGVARVLADAFWPGPLTLVLPALPEVPGLVTAGTGNIGVRVPDHIIARNLITHAGRPVTGTSANRSGLDPCKTAACVESQLGEAIDGIVDAPCGEHAAPSTVVSFAGDRLNVLRHGSISQQRLEDALGKA